MEKEIEEMEKNDITTRLMETEIEEDNPYEIEILSKNHLKYDKSIKIILLGDSEVGKTTILNCLEEKEISEAKNNTMSLEYYNYNIKINNYIIRMQIWDTVGQEKFNSITSNYYKTADIAIFIYAINNINSFNNINNWLNELKTKGSNDNNEIGEKNMIKILVGNKKDLIKERKVTYEMGEKFKNENNFFLFEEINCINNKNSSEDVKNLFINIAKIIYKECVEDKRSRVNSSLYVYEASNSILEIAQDSQETSNIGKKRNKSCCC